MSNSLWCLDYSPPGSSIHGIIPSKDTGVGCHFLLQGIFPAQGSNPCLLNCRQSLHCWTIWKPMFVSVQFSSVAQSCPTLCDPMNCSTPGLPVHHQLLEFTQTHVHRVGDAIQPSHPLLSPSPPAPNPSQHQGLFQWVNCSYQVTKVSEFQPQHQSCQWTLRTNLFQDGLAGSPCSPRDSQESSTLQFKTINSLALSFLYSPTLTSIHDHWKNLNNMYKNLLIHNAVLLLSSCSSFSLKTYYILSVSLDNIFLRWKNSQLMIKSQLFSKHNKNDIIFMTSLSQWTWVWANSGI